VDGFRVIEIFPKDLTCFDFEFVPEQLNSERMEGLNFDAGRKLE
jgi:hypothetical protein